MKNRTIKSCVDCKCRYGLGLFLYLPDDDWEKLGYKPHDYACAKCIIKRIEHNQHVSNIAYLAFSKNGPQEVSTTKSSIEIKVL